MKKPLNIYCLEAFWVRMTGLVARETSVIAIVAQYAPIASAAQVQVANIVCRQLKNCRKSVAYNKKRRTKSSFVGTDDRTCSERNERNSDCCAVCANRVSCTSAGCKHCLPTTEKLSQVRCRNKKKDERSRLLLVRMTGLEPAHYIVVQEPKSCVSANFTTSAKTSLL